MTDDKTSHAFARSLSNVELGFTQDPLEMVGHYVRTDRRPEDMSGRIIAEFTFHNPRYKADAQLFIAAQDLLKVAMLVMDTATIETPMGLLCAAQQAVAKAIPNAKLNAGQRREEEQ